MDLIFELCTYFINTVKDVEEVEKWNILQEKTKYYLTKFFGISPINAALHHIIYTTLLGLLSGRR